MGNIIANIYMKYLLYNPFKNICMIMMFIEYYNIKTTMYVCKININYLDFLWTATGDGGVS